MATFKDKNGKEWSIAIDAPTIRTIRQEMSIDLGDPQGKAYDRMVADPVLLVDVLWLLCKEQAHRDGVTDVQFGRALVGDAIEHATDAMLGVIADFFPPQSRALLHAMTAKAAKVRSMGMEKAMAKINDPSLEEGLLAALDERMDREVRGALTRLSAATSSPEPSE
jgi:hypothetical protein